MSDVSQGPGWWIASDGKWYAPELHPSYSSPPAAPTSRAEVETEASISIPSTNDDDASSSRPALLALLGLVVIGAVAFLGFRLLSGGGSGAGADSPEEAVQGLIDSVNEADPVGLLAAFDPEEAEAWVSSFTPLLSKLDDGTFDQEASNEQIQTAYRTLLSSISLTVTGPDGADPQYEVTTLAEDRLASVRVLGLDIGFDVDEVPATTVVVGVSDEGSAAFDPSALAGFSATLRDDGRGLLGRATSPDGDVEEDYAEDAHLDLVAIQRDGEWYISIGYTVLELARTQGAMNSAALPDFGAAFRAIEQQQGAPTAEDAVRELFAALETLDVQDMIALTDPVAFPYLHDYQPMIDIEIDPAARRDAAETLNLRIDDLALGQAEWEGRTVVTVDRIAGGIAEGGSFSFDFTTWCGQAEAEGDRIEGCADEAIQGGLDQLGDSDTRAADLLPTDLGFVVEERDGSWFVHPLATLGYLMDQSASSLQGFIETNADSLEEQAGSASVESFFAVEAPIVYGNEPVASVPTDGVAGVAINLADYAVDIGTSDDVGVALFDVTLAEPGTVASEYGTTTIEAGTTWGLAIDVRNADNFELPAVAARTEGELAVRLYDADLIVLDDGYAGAIGADGRPVVFHAPVSPVGSPDIQVFGAPYVALPYWEDGSAMLLSEDESFDWIGNGDFIVVYGAAGTSFEIFVS